MLYHKMPYVGFKIDRFSCICKWEHMDFNQSLTNPG